MTKIIAVGDFHGKLSTKLYNAIKKEKPDIILTPGDFCGNERLGKLFFKYEYNTDEKTPRKIKKEIKALQGKSVADGLRLIQKLKQFKVPIYGVLGNWDPKNYPFDIGAIAKISKNQDFKKIKYLQTRKFKLIDFKILELEDFILVGGASSTHPGKIDKKTIEKIKENSEESKRRLNKEIKRRIKEYKRRETIYLKNFTKARELSKKTKKPIIFLTHNAPYGTKLSKLRAKSAPKEVRGKDMGSYLERKMINRFKPDIVVCGHMHENFGKQKLGKKLVINSGTAMEDHYVKFDVGRQK
jgi:Icc-related predicted phosphoesterase